MKDSFVLYTKIKDVLDAMTDEMCGQLFKAIVEYEATGIEPEIENPIVKMAFIPVKRELDINDAKYAETCEKRIEAGKKGGRPKKANGSGKNQTKAKKANGFSKNQTKAKKADYEYEYDNEFDYESDYVNENDTLTGNNTPLNPPKGKRETQEQIFDRLIVDQNIGPAMEEKIREWLKYKAEKRDGYKEQGMKSLLGKIMKAVYEHGETAVMDAIDTSMASGWRGLFFDRIPARGQPRDRMQQTTDMIDRWEIAREEYERRNNDTS